MAGYWKIVERHIGRAGSRRQRKETQMRWDMKYGKDQWAVGYIIDNAFTLQTDALQTVYNQSYVEHFQNHPDDLTELISTAKKLRNPHAEATTGVDLQVPAIMNYLRQNHLKLQGTDVLDIGSWGGQSSHALSIRLSPLTIRCCQDPDFTLEGWWQTQKCLAAWQNDPKT